MLKALRTVCSALIFLKTEFGGTERALPRDGCEKIRNITEKQKGGVHWKYAPFKRAIRLATLANFGASIQKDREELPVPKKKERKKEKMDVMRQRHKQFYTLLTA